MKGDAMTTIFPISLECPVCQAEVSGYQVGSTNTFGKCTSDLYQFAAGAQSIQFGVNVCSACGFSAEICDFSSVGIDALVADRIRSGIFQESQESGLVQSRRYEHAARIADWRGFPDLRIGDLYLKAAWCLAHLEEASDVERESMLRAQVAKYFSQALDAGAVPRRERLAIIYLIGEQFRRNGNEREAARWFDRIVTESTRSTNARTWIDVALRQKYAPGNFLDES
jgi:uncharacterized protein (DUF2225 family)